MKIAFDIDGTLITERDTPNYQVIRLLQFFTDQQRTFIDYDVIVWSGGGIDYARRWVDRLGLKGQVRVIEKGSEEVDIAVDDESVTTDGINAKVVIRVGNLRG